MNEDLNEDLNEEINLSALPGGVSRSAMCKEDHPFT